MGQTQTKSSTGTSDNKEDHDADETVNPEEMVAVGKLMEEQKKILAIHELYQTKYSSATGGFSVEGCVAKTNGHMMSCSLLFVC